jgi:hypothetical protein
MKDLDDLIRTSLREHTPVTAPDDTLADQVTATGRRIRQTRVAGVAALALVLVAGFAWGWAALPLFTQQSIAAVPTMSQPTPSQPIPSPDPSVRDVSRIGIPSQASNSVEFLANYFASPSGNFHCFISSAGAGCAGEKWDKGVKPSRAKVCTDQEPVLGPELWGSAAAAWACGSDPHSLPLLGGGGGEGVAWWDSSFGDSIPLPSDPSTRLAVLPYGKTLVAGDFSCSMAKDGVTCSNSLSGHGFHVSRSKVDLQR